MTSNTQPCAGRPKGSVGLKKMAARHVSEALAALAEVVGDKSAPHAVRVEAAAKILDAAASGAMVQAACSQ